MPFRYPVLDSLQSYLKGRYAALLLSGIDGYDLNVYEYQRGDPRRFQVRTERTLIPNEGETHQQFARRAARQVHAAFADPQLQTVVLVEQVVDYAIAGYTLIAQSAPRLAPIRVDARVACGRHGMSRGVQGDAHNR